MVVNIIWAETVGGAAITSPLSWGGISAGLSVEDDLYIRHDGIEEIYNCAFYITPYVGTYLGGATPIDDYVELQTWGDTDNGFAINQDLTNDFPVENWQTHSSSAGLVDSAFVLDGDSQIGGAGTDGIISTSAEHHIKVRLTIPASVNVVGTRMFTQAMTFTYTS